MAENMCRVDQASTDAICAAPKNAAELEALTTDCIREAGYQAEPNVTIPPSCDQIISGFYNDRAETIYENYFYPTLTRDLSEPVRIRLNAARQSLLQGPILDAWEKAAKTLPANSRQLFTRILSNSSHSFTPWEKLEYWQQSEWIGDCRSEREKQNGYRYDDPFNNNRQFQAATTKTFYITSMTQSYRQQDHAAFAAVLDPIVQSVYPEARIEYPASGDVAALVYPYGSGEPIALTRANLLKVFQTQANAAATTKQGGRETRSRDVADSR